MLPMQWHAVLAAFVVALLFLVALASEFGYRLALDHPNERSLHERPVPRTGGLVIVAGVAAGWAVAQPGFVIVLSLAALLAGVSLLDDIFGLSTLLRLGIHCVVAVALVLVGVGFSGWAQLTVFAVAVAWYTNLYNFMDGSDGLAGGMALIGFGAYAIAAQLSGAHSLATVCAMIAACAAAFLTRNFPPARIFMGDVGSVPLGYLAGGLGLVGWHARLWPLWFPVLVFAPFVCDSTLTLLRRLARREQVWKAHREHYYQRLVRMGFGHRGTALIEYAMMLACASGAVLARRTTIAGQVLTIGAIAVGLGVCATWINLRWTRYVRAQNGAS